MFNKLVKKYISKLLIVSTIVGSFNLVGMKNHMGNIAYADNLPIVKRLFGINRVDTSITISKNIHKSADTVIIVGYKGEIDALTGTLLARKENASMIYADKEKLSDNTIQELKRLNPKKVIILGSEGVIKEEIKDEISSVIEGVDIKRISGDNREETAVNILKEFTDGEEEEIFLAQGYTSSADALAIGAITAKENRPLLLARNNSIGEDTLNIIKELGVKKVHIIGGYAAVSKEVENTLKGLNISIERIMGKNRAETSLKIAKRYIPDGKSIVIANGYSDADAVVGGYFANEKNGPIVLVKDNKILDEVINYIIENKKDIYILGGKNVVSKDLENKLKFALEGQVVKDEIMKEAIPFKSKQVLDNTIESGKTRVKTKGKDGVRTIVQRVYYKDNKEIKRETVSDSVTVNPTDEIVLVGTKKPEDRKIKKVSISYTINKTNLMQEASTSSKIISSIPAASHLEYKEEKGNWYKVEYKNKTGYVKSTHVKKCSGYTAGGILIVNKGYPISKNFNPGINPEALNAINKMKADAKKVGISLNIFSAFRSYSYQASLFSRYAKEAGVKNAERYSARAGHSEHQTGLAFDIGGANSKYYMSEKLGQMKEGIWMATNAHKYGFILRYPKGKEHITGYKYEPWHFRYVGIEIAKKIKDSGLTLDEYFNAVRPNYLR